ncbi:acyl-CoA thioesterase [Tahibacter amnicola]|uniref:Acyl-CoA thioesterase n=1 Tax=Tahibacter amnicola TaxID=2976241 RepID=A0ABY6BBX0_9GAMM|nr:thioesterase family protein [Tahibacter amnicola]UXI67194.1 acyl-CoA thioesterase [Tahibacter amnicola]
MTGKRRKGTSPDTTVQEVAPPHAPCLLASVPIRVRWRDLDAFNHVNNATFLSYLEEARLVWLSQIKGQWFTETYMPVLAATHVNYRQQIEWPGEVIVELYAERLGTASLTVSHRIVDAAQPERLYSDGNVVMVWIEPTSGRSIPLPEAIREACQCE